MWCRLSPRCLGVQDDAVVRAWSQRSVSNRVWQQGLWANAPCWAHTEALAGQFTSLRLSNAPPCSPPCRLGLWRPAFSRTTLAHATLAHTHNSFTRNFLTHTQLVHTHTQLFHSFLTRNSCTHNCFTLIHYTFQTHTHNSSTYNCFLTYRSSTTSFVFPSSVPLQLLFLILEEDDLWGCIYIRIYIYNIYI